MAGPATGRKTSLARLHAPLRRRRNVVHPLLEAVEPVAPVVTRFALGGMDEAGRGPVVGPLVLAGVAVTDPKLPKKLGCTDSKKLSPDRRRAIDRALRAKLGDGVAIEVRVIDAEVLDAERRQGHTMNRIELERFQSIGNALLPARLRVDAADVDAERFGQLLAAALPREVEVVSEHRADANHAIVGAASIVAKVARDEAVAQLGRRLERKLPMPLGSGYPSDPLTKAFLRAWWEKFGTWPEGTRTTWGTIKDILAPAQSALDAFVPLLER